MSFKLGIVGLCTSHPENWVPCIRTLNREMNLDVEIVSAWDSGETRPEMFAEEFCEKFNIPLVSDKLKEMVEIVDGIIVHTANWDRHIEFAAPFIEAGKSVLIDKPIVGNMRDANRLLDWLRLGKRITGGSCLRFSREIEQYLLRPIEERGEVHCAYTAIGVDDFNYGIHGYAIALCLMGSGIKSVQYIGCSHQKHVKITWENGNVVLMTVGKTAWLPFNITIVTSKNVDSLQIDTSIIYRNMLEKELPYLCGKTDKPPLDMDEFLEPEFAAMAARLSWLNNGQEIYLSDLRIDDSGYDGTQFAQEYKRMRM